MQGGHNGDPDHFVVIRQRLSVPERLQNWFARLLILGEEGFVSSLISSAGNEDEQEQLGEPELSYATFPTAEEVATTHAGAGLTLPEMLAAVRLGPAFEIPTPPQFACKTFAGKAAQPERQQGQAGCVQDWLPRCMRHDGESFVSVRTPPPPPPNPPPSRS